MAFKLLTPSDPDENKILATDPQIVSLQGELDDCEADLAGFPDELKYLTTAEIQQLENIGSETVTGTQWGYLAAQTGPVGMTNRGDPAGFDFSVGDFTTDSIWRDLDLSAIVPAGAKTVLLRVQIQDGIVGKSFFLRQKGNTNAYNMRDDRIIVANISNRYDATISCDVNRKIQYRANTTVWTVINITVAGWWF